MHDAATNRDKGPQRKQRAYFKATYPLMQAIVNPKEIEKKQKKSKDTFSKLRDISPLLHQLTRLQNVLFTETQRKRTYNVFSTLGKIFCCYSSCMSTEDHLFVGHNIKKMRQNLKEPVEERQQYSKNNIWPKQALQGPTL